jgi:hypothetical protein
VVDVAHPVPPQAPAAGHSLGADHRGKAPIQIVQSLDVDEKERDFNTNVDAYLNMAMFLTQQVRIL